MDKVALKPPVGRYLDLYAPHTLKLVAALPFYGQAAQVIRRIDPFWKTETEEPREWEVSLEKWHGCNCCYCEPDHKTVIVEALSGEDATALIEGDDTLKDWEISQVRLPRKGWKEGGPEVPDSFYRAASELRPALSSQGGER